MSSSPPHLEKLKEEIVEKTRFISSLPLPSDSAKLLFEAKHRQILGEKREEYELTLEAQRRASVVREHEGRHPPVTETCPICLEEIPTNSLVAMSYFTCCGNGCCRKCSEAAHGEGINRMPTCPLCRAVFPRARKELINLTKKRAKDGRSWAQVEIGLCYLNGLDGFPVDRIEALKWFKLAAAQRHPEALYRLSESHFQGSGSSFGPYDSKALAMMKESANMGNVNAQENLGFTYFWGRRGPMDKAKAAYFSTLSYAQNSNPAAGFILGLLFFEGSRGLSKSLYRAKYYLEEAADKGYLSANAPLGLTLLQLCEAQYSTHSIPGHCCIPRVLCYARKAAGDGQPAAVRLVADLENKGQQSCANCHRGALCIPSKLNRCARCKAAWYCGKKCQTEHWKAGHKIDCVKQ